MIKRIVAGIAGAALWVTVAFAQFPPGTGPLVPNSPGGSSGITPNSTTCTGCSANSLLGSDGSKVQNQAVPSCSTALSALTWTTNTGFGCNTFAAAATLAANTFTGIQTLPRGLVGAPVITFGDSTSGFWSAGANKVDLSISGTTYFDCNDVNTGRCTFGVGVTSSGDILSTTQFTSSSSSSGRASFYSTGTVSRPILLINANPNFGVLSTDSAHQFWLGYSGTQAAGTAVITWTDNGAVTIAPNSGLVAITGDMSLSTAAPTVGAGVIGYGGTTAAAANCNVTSPTPTGCVVINVAGTTRYLPYY